MTKQKIVTEDQPNALDKISVLTTALETQLIESVEGYWEGIKFKSSWDEIDQGLIKEKIKLLIKEL